MTTQWDFYLSLVDDQPASIFLDLGLVDSVPLPGLDTVVWLRLFMKDASPNGLPSRAEFDALARIGDALDLSASATPGLHSVGRCTANGTRDFYFYAADGPQSEQTLKAALKSFPDYAFETGSRADADWRVYTDFLYPTPWAMQTISNQHTLDALEEGGDRSEAPREIVHWIYFSAARSCDSFASAALELGYREHSRANDAEPPLPYCLVVAKTSDALPETIHKLTWELFELADRTGGVYDGWETSIEE